MNRYVGWLVVVLLIGTLIVASLGASATQSSVGWQTTSDFNGGALSSIDTVTQNPCVAVNSFQLNMTGGNYGPSVLCPSMSPYIATTSQAGSYGNAYLVSDALHDYSVNRNDLVRINSGSLSDAGTVVVPSGAPHSSNAIYVFGTGALLSSNTRSFTTSPGWAGAVSSPSAFTFASWVRLNMSSCGSSICTLNGDAGQSRGSGYVWDYFNTNTGFFVVQYYSAGAQNANCGSFNADSAWHAYVIRYNYTGKLVQCFVDGSSVGSVTMTGSPTTPTTVAQQLFWGSYDGSNFGLKAPIDSMQVAARWWTNAEITAFSTSGKYTSSGTWTTPTVSGHTDNPGSVEVTYTGASASSVLEGFTLKNGGGTTLWSDDVHLTSGSIVIDTIAISNATLVSSWTLVIQLTGDQTATVNVISVAVTFVPVVGPPPKPVVVVNVTNNFNPVNNIFNTFSPVLNNFFNGTVALSTAISLTLGVDKVSVLILEFVLFLVALALGAIGTDSWVGPLMTFVAGIVGVVMSLQVYAVTTQIIPTLLTLMVALLVFVYGAFKQFGREERKGEL